MDAAAVAAQQRQLFDAFRADPGRMVSSGIMTINSAYECDREGNVIRRQESKNGAMLSAKFWPNLIQRRILETRRQCIKDGQRFNIEVLKARSVGATLLMNGLIVGHCATTQGARAIVVSHVPKSAETVYAMGRQMIKALPEWIRPSMVLDSVARLEATNPPWGITHSSITNVHAEAIESILGDRCLILAKDESARYGNADEVFTATNSLVLDVPQAMSIDISTSFGHDKHFHPRFMEDWEVQGSMNVWEDGAQRYKRATIAAFFPWYWDATKSAKVPDEVGYKWLLGDLDEYEKDLYRTLLNFFGGSQKTCLDRLYWRRSKIMTEYRHMPVKAQVPTQVRTVAQFCREEPATVEEAFDVVASGVVIPAFMLDEIRRTDIKKPLLSGIMQDGRPVSRAMEEFSDLDGNTVRLWKMPADIKGRLIAGCDPSAGMLEIENPKWTYERDFTYAPVFEELADGTLEQVAEYVNQRPARATAPDLFHLFRWLASGDEDRMPEFVIERAFGKDVLMYFFDMSYPLWKIYRQIRDERAGRQSAALWGFSPANASHHVSAVGYWADMMCTRRMIIRSIRLWSQAKNFIQVKDDKFQAVGKGKRSENSKDDGIDGCCFVAYLYQNSGPQPSRLDGGFLDNSGFAGFGGLLPRPETVGEDVRPAVEAQLAALAKGVKYWDLPTKKELESGTVQNDHCPFDLSVSD